MNALPFAAVMAFALNVCLQTLYCRLTGKSFKSIFAGFGTGLAALAAFDIYSSATGAMGQGDLLPLGLVDAVTYFSLGYCYVAFLGLGESARRPRLLMELHGAEDGLSMDELLERYNARYMVDVRIQRLLSSGQIMERDGRYFINSKFLLLTSKTIVAMKLFVLGKRSEFD